MARKGKTTNTGITHFKTGCIPWNKGVPMSEEAKRKNSEAHKGRVSGNKGKKISEETRKQISESRKGKHVGENHWNYIKDRTKTLENHRLRSTQEWADWRAKIFERDKYTCMECRTSGVYIEPHHIIPIRSDMENLFNTKNGITLCRPCHQKTIWKESDYEEKYLNIVAKGRSV